VKKFLLKYILAFYFHSTFFVFKVLVASEWSYFVMLFYVDIISMCSSGFAFLLHSFLC